MKNQPWTRDELILALDVYFRKDCFEIFPSSETRNEVNFFFSLGSIFMFMQLLTLLVFICYDFILLKKVFFKSSE